MITVRIRFEKTGEAAYISLLDLQRVFHRILKRSGLPVYYTQGFNPHIYLSFACPLSLGQESLCECCEVKTEAEDPQLDTWCDVLQPYMPRGIKVLSAQQAQNKVAEIDHASYLVTLPASAAAALDAYNAAENAMVVKKTKRQFLLRPFSPFRCIYIYSCAKKSARPDIPSRPLTGRRHSHSRRSPTPYRSYH